MRNESTIKTQPLAIEVIGTHSRCGGEAVLICGEGSGSRHCVVCSDKGPNVMLESEAPKPPPLPAISGLIERASGTFQVVF